MSPTEPTQLGPYRLLERLGQGGMAMVYRGERTGEAGFKKRVALKRMLPQYRRNPALLERFAAEARTNARLDHPNLVAVADFGIEPEPYLVMEYVEGVTLALLLQRLVEQSQKLEIAAACFIGTEAAQGLDHAHRKRDENGNPLGIVHRDVSPQNVLLSNEGAVKVSDFGLVKAADNVVQTGSGVPIGKMSYMAPEQADHHEVDARADVFSLGIVVWEMLTMRTLMPPNDPIRSANMLMACDFPPPSRFNPDVPPALDAAVMRCLHREPGERTPTAQAFGMQLREFLHEVAPGYGRDQLSRLLGWVFPERGWIIDEPHETAAQPTARERASMPHVHAAEAMQRASAAPPEPVPPEDHAVATMPNVAPAAPIAPPSQVVPTAMQATAKRSGSSGLIWLLVLGALGFAFLVIAIAIVLVVVGASRSAPVGAAPPARSATDEAPMEPVPGTAPNVMAVTIEAGVPGARVFLGARELGLAPVRLSQPELNGDPLIVLAPGHQPSIVAPEQLSDALTSGRPVERVHLVPHGRPDLVVYVRHPRQASARLAFSRELIGAVPGVLLVPSQTPMGGRPQIEIVEAQAVVLRMPTERCDPTAVCLLEGGPAVQPPRVIQMPEPWRGRGDARRDPPPRRGDESGANIESW